MTDHAKLHAWLQERAQIARREAIAAGSRIDRQRAASLAQGRSIDWIASHRPMRDSGQSWGDSSRPYRPIASPRMIKADR